MASPLLLLPGELRNNIFTFVFSEADGLNYVQDDSGIGWLCLHGPDRDAASTITPDTAMHTVNNGHVVANQLQFVCRQLHRETKTLGILYNTIAFNCPSPSTILAFLNGLPAHLQHRPHKFVLRENPHENNESFYCGFAAIFNTYPRCRVKFHHPRVVPSEPYCILVASLIIGYAARNDLSFVKKLSNSVSVQQYIIGQLDQGIDCSAVKYLAPYLTVFPHEDVLDEDAFRAACLEHWFIREWLIPTLRNGLDDLVIVARDVYENGL